MAITSPLAYRLSLSLLWLAAPAALAANGASPLAGAPLTTLPKLDAPKAPQPKVQIQRADPQQALAQLLAQPVTPRHFAIEGVKTLPFDQVAAYFAPLLGQPVTVGALVRAAEQVSQFYQRHGYVLSSCFIPTQDFADGKVQVAVVEGYVAEVVVHGNPGATKRKIRAIAGELQREAPLQRATLERVLNLLAQLPGMKIAASVAPPQNMGGAAELHLDVRRRPVTAGVGLVLNHPGVRGLFTVNANGLTRLAEQLSVSVLAPRGRDHEDYVAASLSVPLGHDGLQLRLDGSHYQGKPQDLALQSQALERNVVNDRLGLTLSYPFLLSNSRSLTGSLSGYAADNSDKYRNTVNGASLNSKSNLRVLQGELNYVAAEPDRVLRLGLGLARGFNALGANRDVLVSTGSTLPGQFALSFSKLLAHGSYSRDWPWQLGTVASFAGQYSRSTLPASEQTSFGGTRFGLGYPAGEIAGDSGWGASLEANRSIAAELPYLKQIKPYLLVDAARVNLNQSALKHSRIASVAAGLRFSDSKHYNLDLAIAKPVGEAPQQSRSRGARLNASFSYQFD